MEENNVENAEIIENITVNNNSNQQIAGAILIAGLLIAGAILLKSNTATTQNYTPSEITLTPVGTSDRTLGNPNAKIALIVYEDFQCPFCERFFKDSEKIIRDTYVKNGDIQLVYRDFAFLGPESVRTAEAARCAGDQNKFWEYHDYLYNHQNGENKGSFADSYLKSFAKNLDLNTMEFNSCLDQNKYEQTVLDAKAEASKAGVKGTPKGFLVTKKDISKKTQDEILKSLPPDSEDTISFYTNKNIVSLNGALPYTMVKPIIDILLK